MTAFNLTLTGDGDADDIREAFNSTVNALRPSITAGSLELDGVPYAADEVPEAEDTNEEPSDEANDTSDDAPEEAPAP
jgi:hypothetical protein